MIFCSQCGAKVEDGNVRCPSCGTSLISSLSSTDAKSSPSSVVEKKKMPLWFKIIACLAVLALVGVTGGILFTESWVDVVDLQLEALRQHDLAKAYNAYTSKEFQSATSFEQFNHFINTYPVFLNNQSAHFTQRSVKDHIRTLKGNLTSHDHAKVPIEYKLIKEDDKWKILSIRLLKAKQVRNAKEVNEAKALVKLAKNQLKDIQDHKWKEAYQKYSSQEFKKATSEEDFQAFVKRYPILTHYQTVSFYQPIIRDGAGTLAGVLHLEQIATYVKYYFIYEDQAWKIWSMRMLSSLEEEEDQAQQNQSTHSQLGCLPIEHPLLNALNQTPYLMLAFSGLPICIARKSERKGLKSALKSTLMQREKALFSANGQNSRIATASMA